MHAAFRGGWNVTPKINLASPRPGPRETRMHASARARGRTRDVFVAGLTDASLLERLFLLLGLQVVCTCLMAFRRLSRGDFRLFFCHLLFVETIKTILLLYTFPLCLFRKFYFQVNLKETETTRKFSCLHY